MQNKVGTLLFLTALSATAATVSSSLLHAQDVMAVKQMDTTQMMAMMRTWPAASKDAAMFMMKKYGAPATMSADMAMWGVTGPWKRTIVFGVEFAHEFPMHHTDVMQQWIDYRAPAAKYDDLAMYDGSVVLERTSGEMSARCDKEAANFLALNLANDIVTGKRTVANARQMYGAQITEMKAMRPAPYTEKLMFTPMANTNDPDQALAGAMAPARPARRAMPAKP